MQRQRQQHTEYTYIEQEREAPAPATPLLDEITSPLTPILEASEIERAHEEALALDEQLEASFCACGQHWSRCIQGVSMTLRYQTGLLDR